MAGPIVIACPSCHTGSQKAHCESPTCTWRVCARCQLLLSMTADGHVRAVTTKASS